MERSAAVPIHSNHGHVYDSISHGSADSDPVLQLEAHTCPWECQSYTFLLACWNLNTTPETTLFAWEYWKPKELHFQCEGWKPSAKEQRCLNRNMKKKTKGQEQSCSTAGVEILHANKSCSVRLLKSDTPSAEVLNNLNSYTPTAKLFPSNDIDFKSYTPWIKLFPPTTYWFNSYTPRTMLFPCKCWNPTRQEQSCFHTSIQLKSYTEQNRFHVSIEILHRAKLFPYKYWNPTQSKAVSI